MRTSRRQHGNTPALLVYVAMALFAAPLASAGAAPAPLPIARTVGVNTQVDRSPKPAYTALATLLHPVGDAAGVRLAPPDTREHALGVATAASDVRQPSRRSANARRAPQPTR